MTVTTTLAAASLTQTAGTGTTQFNGQVDNTGAGTNFSITTNAIDINANINTNGGDVVLNGAANTGNAVDLVNTAAINTRLTGGVGGAVDIDASTAGGNINLAGGINTSGDDNAGGAGFDAGNVSVTAVDGTIDALSITATRR